MVHADALIATNTSSISIFRLAVVLKNPARFVGMHFFDPVPLTALVEVIRGGQTADETATAVIALATCMGKTPVDVRNAPGFVVNRLLCPKSGEERGRLPSVGLALACFSPPSASPDPRAPWSIQKSVRSAAENG